MSAIDIPFFRDVQKGRKIDMKKRFLTAVLMTAMAVMTVAGCGGSQGNADSVENEGSAEDGGSVENGDSVEPQVQGDGTVYKVGIVQYVDDASLNQIEKAIEEELDAKSAELGVTFDYADYTYNGQADASTLNQIAADLVAEGVDVIIPIATPAAMIMQNATEENQIPVVFSAVSDPVGAGLVASMDAPGANITGTSDALDTQAVLNLIMAANPQTAKLGLLYCKSEPSSDAPIAEAIAFCEANGIAYVEKTGTTVAELSAGADALVAEGVDAIFTPTDNTVMTAELAIYEKFIEAKIPHYTGADSFALNGAFCGYGVNYAQLGTATADMAVEILMGASPATTAVQTLDNGIVTVNTETAEAIGLDYSMFADMCDELKEIITAKEFE